MAITTDSSRERRKPADRQASEGAVAAKAPSPSDALIALARLLARQAVGEAHQHVGAASEMTL